MLASGVRQGGTVAIGLFNGDEYLEAFFAARRIRAMPVEVDYRYGGGGLALLTQLDSVVFSGHGVDRVGGAAERIITALRATMAGYKVPGTLVFADVPRAPNDKMLQAEAREVLMAAGGAGTV
ncbi:hypothetical protein [Gordonia polyisoprenivorans]|uniref:hypothetical protein n=1 Tax=Gordonia polyisoprenivorans TaxID=84595 RepID=UPI001AD71793|nr:hypothetical protein [Gordonia polyisoprenivorans]QTI70993.1 hypothetical protein J6U32_10970 [Gordonia polyisoprenivorans]